jgi:hypothetical protein
MPINTTHQTWLENQLGAQVTHGETVQVGDFTISRGEKVPTKQVPSEVKLHPPGTIITFDACGCQVERSELKEPTEFIEADAVWDIYLAKLGDNDKRDLDETFHAPEYREAVSEVKSYLGWPCPNCEYNVGGIDPSAVYRAIPSSIPLWECLGCGNFYEDKNYAEKCCMTEVPL